MVMEIFLLEVVLVLNGWFYFTIIRAGFSKSQERLVLQGWLDNVMRDAEQHRERVGNQYQLKMYDSDRGRELDEWFTKRQTPHE